MHHLDDTIAAIASAPGGAARGIVRVSGPRLLSILERCFQAHDDLALAAVRRARVVPGRILVSASRVRELPADLLLWPTARSYTREPLAELHSIGSPPLLSAILRTVCSAGARLAEPGEFTLRAFLAGRLDLVQAEAVLGVIDARDASELQEALGQLAGGLTRPLHQLRQSLIELLAHIEAGLDFVEEDIQFIQHEELGRQLDDAVALVERLATQLAHRGRQDVLPSAVLVGSPNVGKSSLFNALTIDGTALVADQPGTTRDYLTATLELDGLGCRLLDTAGVEPFGETGGDGPGAEIDDAARRLTAREAQRGDLRLWCLDSTRALNDEERQRMAANSDGPQLVVLTKCDRPSRIIAPSGAIETSAHGGLGLVELRQVIRQALIEQSRAESGSHLTADRCGESLRRSSESLARAAELNRSRAGQELIASELRVALDELSNVVGATYTEDILDRVFSRFCIGK